MVLGKRSYSCACQHADNRRFYLKQPHIKYNRLHPIIIQRFIEKNCSQKKCLDYQLSIMDFGRNARGIEEACHLYFNKEVNDLNEEEVIQLHFMQIATFKYNPISNPQNLEKAVQATLKKLSKN